MGGGGVDWVHCDVGNNLHQWGSKEKFGICGLLREKSANGRNKDKNCLGGDPISWYSGGV